MKKFQFILVLISFMGLILIGCSDKSPSPVAPTADQSPKVSLDKKGRVVHQVVGSGNMKYEGKIIVSTFTAREYADGTVDGQYEINMQSLFQAKEHGNVLSLKVYYDVPGYGTVAIIGGQIKNSTVPEQLDIYECYVIVDNGKAPDFENWWIPYLDTREKAEVFWNADPLDFINGFDTPWGAHWDGASLFPCEMGNFHIK